MTKILIVDDEPRILLLMKSLLKANGFEVETAKDGPAALEIVRSGEIQIVVTDLRMSLYTDTINETTIKVVENRV